MNADAPTSKSLARPRDVVVGDSHGARSRHTGGKSRARQMPTASGTDLDDDDDDDNDDNGVESGDDESYRATGPSATSTKGAKPVDLGATATVTASAKVLRVVTAGKGSKPAASKPVVAPVVAPSAVRAPAERSPWSESGSHDTSSSSFTSPHSAIKSQRKSRAGNTASEAKVKATSSEQGGGGDGKHGVAWGDAMVWRVGSGRVAKARLPLSARDLNATKAAAARVGFKLQSSSKR